MLAKSKLKRLDEGLHVSVRRRAAIILSFSHDLELGELLLSPVVNLRSLKLVISESRVSLHHRIVQRADVLDDVLLLSKGLDLVEKRLAGCLRLSNGRVKLVSHRLVLSLGLLNECKLLSLGIKNALKLAELDWVDLLVPVCKLLELSLRVIDVLLEAFCLILKDSTLPKMFINFLMF